MHLHKDRELFLEVVNFTSAALGVPVPIVEKDYYVTMILKLLAERADGCVFKGGTFQNERIDYETAIDSLRRIVESEMFKDGDFENISVDGKK